MFTTLFTILSYKVINSFLISLLYPTNISVNETNLKLYKHENYLELYYVLFYYLLTKVLHCMCRSQSSIDK